MVPKVRVESDRSRIQGEYRVTDYSYQTTRIRPVSGPDSEMVIEPVQVQMQLRSKTVVPKKTGVMLVGWGGNNGSTFTGVILANQMGLKWNSKTGLKDSNFYGSVFQSSTVALGVSEELTKFGNRKEVCVKMRDLVPMVDPCQLEIDGWDVSSMNLADAMDRAQVFEPELKSQLRQRMQQMKPRKSVFYADYLASNQEDRADNVLTGSLSQLLALIRKDISEFRSSRKIDHLIVMWTASTERFSDITPGINDTAEALLKSVEGDLKDQVAPSTLFAIASVLEGCTFINGSPQNTLVPGVVELAQQKGVHLAGDDFKTGQTKVKSSLAEFLLNSGIKPTSIVSYNHLGNNDGKNLSSQKQFRSKEITKSGVIDDMVIANPYLYPTDSDHPDHCIVIKYVPYVGDSKRAMDEYTSEICMHGNNTLVIHNTCEDSLLAVGVMVDLVLCAELCTRLSFRIVSDSSTADKPAGDDSFHPFDCVLSTMGLFLKSPATAGDEPSINAFSRQRSCIENLLRAFVGLPPNNHMLLEYKVRNSSEMLKSIFK